MKPFNKIFILSLFLILFFTSINKGYSAVNYSLSVEEKIELTKQISIETPTSLKKAKSVYIRKKQTGKIYVGGRFVLMLVALGLVILFTFLFLITGFSILGVLASFVFTPLWCVTMNWLLKGTGPEKIIRKFEIKKKS